MMLRVVVALSLLGLAIAKPKWQECGPCAITECPEPISCVAGEVLDSCDCCSVCARAEGEFCDLGSEDSNKIEHGICGDNLVCQPRGSGAVCVCDYQETLCGTDGVTYRNLCHMSEVVALEHRPDLRVKSKGACDHAPRLISGPSNMKNMSGGYVAMACEAEGSPIPNIDWLYTRADGEVIYLPGDSENVSVNMRGGPGKNQVTGWIQIIELEKKHEGDYTCMAHNVHGSEKAQARLLVVEQHEQRQADL